ncbi:hypothetical protein, partial [Marinobacter sp.]|uniref:hypothetical protein n=1 Tax=Marinobacter sp. TaxID=50741 RepID=UPI0025C42D93
NPRPSPCKGDALPAELTTHFALYCSSSSKQSLVALLALADSALLHQPSETRILSISLTESNVFRKFDDIFLTPLNLSIYYSKSGA